MKKLIFLPVLICLTGLFYSCQPVNNEMPITTVSDEALDLFYQARELHENQEKVPADELFNRAIQLDPEFAMAFNYLGDKENVSKALELIELVTTAEAYCIKSANTYNDREYKLSLSLIDSALAEYPEDKHILFKAGQIASATDRTLAIEYYDKAIEVDDSYAAAHCLKGYLLMYNNEMEQAEECLVKYLDLRPESGNAVDSYGDLLSKQRKYEESNVQYLKAFELEPSFHFVFYKMGWNDIRSGQFDNAAENFKKYENAAQNDNERYNAMLFQVLLDYIQEKYDQAFEKLDAMKQVATDEENKLMMLQSCQYKGWIKLESGDPAGAIPYFQEWNDMVPEMEFESFMSELGYMYGHGNLSMALAFADQIEQAEKELLQSKEIYDNRVNSIGDTNFMNLYQGALAICKGNYEEAIGYMEKSANSGSVTNQYYVGLAYDKAGNKEKALEYYTKAHNSANPYFTAFYYNKTKTRISELKQ